ncbi:MAG: EAL domain-containing protein [Hylemonella sp.]
MSGSKRRMPWLWAWLTSAIVVAVPLMAALALAERQSRLDQLRLVSQIANEVLQRSHRVSAQIMQARAELTQPGLRPCSPHYMQLIAQVSANSSLLIGVGYVRNDFLLCSTFGHHGRGIPLGPADYLSRTGHQIRSAARLPGLALNPLLLSTHQASGYTAMVHPSIPIDMLSDQTDLSLGLVNARSLRTLTQRGDFQPAWIRALDSLGEDRMFDGQHFIAIQRSPLYDYAAYAALPASRLDRSRFDFMLLLVPLGIGSGLLLAMIIFRFTQRRLSLAARLRVALRRGEFHLLYQPVVELQSGRWIGAEALIRWRRPDGDDVPPDTFIAVAERVGLIQQITRQVCQLCMRDLQAVLQRHPDFRISLNMSAADFSSHTSVDFLARLIQQHGLQPRQFQVEVTERGLLDQNTAREVLQRLQVNGIRVAIDDFGTGYSSLGYLTTLEVDCLKIDRIFVETIGVGAATSHVVSHIIAMAKSLQLDMIAEGVEHAHQADYLRQQGVQYGQGWFYARPLDAQALAAGLDAQNTRPAA